MQKLVMMKMMMKVGDDVCYLVMKVMQSRKLSSEESDEVIIVKRSDNL